MRRYLPEPNFFVGKTVPGHSQIRIISLINKGSDALVFHAKNKSTGYEYACRIVPPENMPEDDGERKEWLNAAKRISNELSHSAVVRCQDDLVWPLDDENKNECAAFLYEYIEGPNLAKYVQDHTIEISFIKEFLLTMFELLHELKQRNISHGDLHAGNVIVASPSATAINPRPSIRVIDFGVHHISSSIGGESDYHRVAGMLKMLLAKVDSNNPDLGARDKYIWRVLRDEFAGRHLIEDDPTIDNMVQNPEGLYRKIENLDKKYADVAHDRTVTKMLTPFDYPNCEQMGNLHLLLDALYSDRFLGLTEIEARNNLVLTGPRGCGKTTIFRALSLDHKIKVERDDPADIAYVGIYYRCDDLYFSFPRFRASDIPEAIDIPMHYLIVSMIRETLVTIKNWSFRHFFAEYRQKEPGTCKRLWEALDLDPPDAPGSMSFDAISDRLQKERVRAAEKYRFQHDPGQGFGRYLGPQYLERVCKVLKEEFLWLDPLPFYFFVDDYSDPKITTDLQKNLNRLVLQRSEYLYFKISTESPVSFVPQDVDKKSYVETREYELLNLGMRYIKAGPQDKLPFLDGLFERRFGEVDNYPVSTLEELIGDHERNENELARQMRERKIPPDTYSGRTTLALLCSGDIHYMIRLVGSMVSDVGGVEALRSREPDSPRIKFSEQHNAVKKNAGEFLNSVRMLPEIGQHLADVITAFGNVARSYLLYKTSKNESTSPPHQAMRIEPYESVALEGEAGQIMKALLRYSIFLEDPRGKSRRGHIVPRYYLRRYLIPKLNLTLSGRDSIEVEPEELEELLTNPSVFESRRRLKSPEGISPPSNFDLIDELGKGKEKKQ